MDNQENNNCENVHDCDSEPNIDNGVNNSAGQAQKKSLKINFIFNLISQILTLALPLITAPYVARVLHEEGVGQFSYASSIITYFTLFANLGFDIYGQRQIARYQDDIEKKSKVFWEIFIIRTCLTAVALAVLYGILFSVGFGKEYNSLIFISSLSVICIPLDIQFFYRGDEDFVTLAIKSILVKVVMIALIFIFVKDQADLWIYALCSVGVTVVSNLILWPTIVKKIKRVPIKSLSLNSHIKPAIVIFLPTLATTIYAVFDKTMIGLLANNPDYENGCYEQAYRINSVALILVTVLSSLMVSRNAHDYSVGDIDDVKRHLNFSSSYIWMIGLPLIVGFAVLSNNLSSWFLGDGYEKAPLLMQIMSVRFIISGFGDMFGSQLFIAIQKEIYPTIATFISAAVNVVLNIILIPIYGSVGAAIATAVCEVIVTVFLFIFARKQKFILLRKTLLLSWKYVVASLVMFIPIYFMQRNMGNSVLTFFVIMLVGIIAYALALLILRDRFFINNAKNLFLGVKSKLFRKKVKEHTLEANNNDVDTVENQEETIGDNNIDE